MKRLGTLLSLAVAVAVPSAQAWADDDDDEEDDDDDDGGDEEEEEEEDEGQPAVTAGGLFTLETYPQAENLRPLTITKGITELRAGIDIDMSATQAFKNWGINAEFRHGLEDNVELQGGVRSDLNHFQDLRMYAAVEFGIVYDLVDFRGGIAITYDKTPDEAVGLTTTAFDLEIGFPFRYAPKPEISVVALDTFMTFNFTGNSYTLQLPEAMMIELNAKTPDLTPSLGLVVQPAPMLAIKAEGKVYIRDFNTEAANFLIPVSLDVQFSPNNRLDMGLEFTFPNLKPPEGVKFTDSRFLLLYGQYRI